MSPRSARRLTAVLVAALLAGGGALAGASSERDRVRATRPAPAAGQPLPAAATVPIDLVLRLRHTALADYISAVADPSSPAYGHYLSAAQFGQRFGIGARATRLLSKRLAGLGLPVVASYPQQTALGVRASAAELRRVFGVTLRRFVTASGSSYLKPDRAPRIPAALAPWVASLAGLDTQFPASTDSIPNGVIVPNVARTAYNVTPLYAAGDRGQGQTIAVLSVDGLSLAHYKRFANQFSLAGPTPKIVALSPISQNGPVSKSSETDLDTQIVHSIAPAAQIIDYQVSFSDLAAAINSIVKAGTAKIITGSFGMCDGTSNDSIAVPDSYRSDVENALASAAAGGYSFFFSTGDTGAYDCQRSDPNDTNLTVEFPSDAPYTVAVGGTVLSVNSDDSYQSETGWEDSGSNGGGGGGINPFDAAPKWESDAQVNGVSNGHRQTPDVSAAAGDASAWLMNDGSTNPGGWDAAYGTSAATPFWAASMLLVQQFMVSHHAGPLCFATPLLYGIAGETWRNPPFHDVVLGGNRYYQAGPGWDFATGWGSPNVGNLATAAVAYRRQHPLPSAGNACRAAIN